VHTQREKFLEKNKEEPVEISYRPLLILLVWDETYRYLDYCFGTVFCIVVSLVVFPPGVTVVLGPTVVDLVVAPPLVVVPPLVVPPPLLLLLPPPPQLAKKAAHRTKAIAKTSSFFVPTNAAILKNTSSSF
jgi:hypothetical protein